MKLFIEQKAAIEKLSLLRAGALFMKMGTGKTRTALELALCKKVAFDILIWIAPASLVYERDYLSEINKWSANLKIVFFTVEGISQSDRLFLEMRKIAEENKVFCVIDESLSIKNTDAGRTKRLTDMWHLFDFRLILNGTPLSKGLIDLYAQINFIHPNILNMTEAQFAHNFLQFKKDGYKPWNRWSLPENEEALIETIRPYIFDAELDIDVEVSHLNNNFRLTNHEVHEYHDFKEHFMRDKFTIDFLSVSQAFQAQYTLSEQKINWVRNKLDEFVGQKTIIFVKFHKEVDFFKDNFDCLEYSGRHKDSLSDLNKKDILVCTYGTGSKGLNLQICQNVIFFSQTFDWSHKKHGLHRVLRKKQTKDITIHDLWLNTGLEKLFKASLNKKTNVAGHVGQLIDKKQAMEL